MAHSILCPCNSVGVNENCGRCSGTGYLTLSAPPHTKNKTKQLDPRPLIAKFGSPKARAEQEAWRKSREKICQKCNRHLQPEDYNAHMAQMHAERVPEPPAISPAASNGRLTGSSFKAVNISRLKIEAGQSNLVTYDDFSHLPSAVVKGSIDAQPQATAGKKEIDTSPWMRARNDSRLLQTTDRMDANLGMGFFARENGRYGSHPIHDRFDDDSNP